MAVDPADANELADIEQIDATVEARRNALAVKWGEGTVVLVKPGDTTGLTVRKGKLHAFKITYLTGGPTS
jgi:hypothetical protein